MMNCDSLKYTPTTKLMVFMKIIGFFSIILLIVRLIYVEYNYVYESNKLWPGILECYKIKNSYSLSKVENG